MSKIFISITIKTNVGELFGGKIRREKKREIFEVIKKAGKISLKEIKVSTKVNYNTIRRAVVALTKAGLIERVDRGTYKVK